MAKYPNALVEYNTSLSKTVNKLNVMTNLELKHLIINQLYHSLPKDEIEYKKMVEYNNEINANKPQDIDVTKLPTYFGNILENHKGHLFFFYTKDIDNITETTFTMNKCTIDELIDRRISSPKSNEIFLPLSIDTNNMNKYTLTPKRKHKRKKSHVTHKLIKRTKSKSSRSKSSKSKSRKTRSKSTPVLDLL